MLGFTGQTRASLRYSLTMSMLLTILQKWKTETNYSRQAFLEHDLLIDFLYKLSLTVKPVQ